MKKSILWFLTCLVVITSCQKKNKKLTIPSKPNIVLIYTDDLGYGDIGVHGAKGVKTPNIDKLAENGIDFTDAHSSAATCTPSRFSLLAGSYAFRRNAAILPGTAPLIFDLNKGTLPSMLKRAGYKTSVVGKWHLGMGRGNVNWNKEITPGPLEVGFDYSLVIPATPDRVPTALVENHRVKGLDPDDPLSISYDHQLKGGYPIGLNHPNKLVMMADSQHSGAIINGVSRIGYEAGGKSAMWDIKQFPFEFTNQAIDFMERNKDQPFFLYFASNDIHVPRMPNQKFRGKSMMGRRGDSIAEADWCVGKIIEALKDMGIAKNTLIIFTSDNGPILNDGYGDEAKYLLNGHKPSGPYNGGKYSAFEAGTRVPFIVSWPGVVEPGKSDALMSQVDLYASLAHLTGQTLQPGSAPDSFNMLNTLLGKSDKGRKYLLEQAFTMALRDDNWKYIAPQENPTPEWLKNKDVATGLTDTVQLYNLKDDVGEQQNVANQHPDLVKKLQQKLRKIREQPTRERVLQQEHGGQ